MAEAFQRNDPFQRLMRANRRQWSQFRARLLRRGSVHQNAIAPPQWRCPPRAFTTAADLIARLLHRQFQFHAIVGTEDGHGDFLAWHSGLNESREKFTLDHASRISPHRDQNVILFEAGAFGRRMFAVLSDMLHALWGIG